MDVSVILQAEAEKHKSVTVEKEIPLDVDAGYLTVTDINPIDSESYSDNLEEHLQVLARDGTQTLFTSLFSLPTISSEDGPLAQLPAPQTMLPRAKALPKPKPPTKWEQFAAAKGIQKKKKDKRVWDEERQEWVNRWGRDGKNKQVEEQWITEVPLNADADHDPRKAARDERKSRVAKNEKQRLANTARAQGADPRATRKHAIDRTLATSRVSTASMGRFDNKLEGEKKLRGVKRKFDPAEGNIQSEQKASLALVSKMDSDAKKSRRESKADDSVLNVRKAVRFASKGSGALVLGRESSKTKSRKASKGKR